MEKTVNAVFNFSHKNKVMILGDMNELGELSKAEHIKIGKLTKTLKVNDVFFIGNKMKYAHQENVSSLWYENVHDLIKGLEKLSFKNSDILIKGSRSSRMERVVDEIKRSFPRKC